MFDQGGLRDSEAPRYVARRSAPAAEGSRLIRQRGDSEDTLYLGADIELFGSL